MDFADGDELNGTNLTRTYLQKAADRAGIDFLQQSDPSSEERWGPPMAGSLGSAVVSSRFDSRPAPEGWGLND
jgi:hypothetical protein